MGRNLPTLLYGDDDNNNDDGVWHNLGMFSDAYYLPEEARGDF